MNMLDLLSCPMTNGPRCGTPSSWHNLRRSRRHDSIAEFYGDACVASSSRQTFQKVQVQVPVPVPGRGKAALDRWLDHRADLHPPDAHAGGAMPRLGRLKRWYERRKAPVGQVSLVVSLVLPDAGPLGGVVHTPIPT
eukprot:gene12434-8896_t